MEDICKIRILGRSNSLIPVCEKGNQGMVRSIIAK